MSIVSKADLVRQINHGLIVSCQPVDGSAMDKPEIVAAMAQAAESAGAAGLRIEGIDNLLAVRPRVNIPIVGIIKRDLPDSEVRITPWLEDVDALAAGGADIIAFDATIRRRPVRVEALFRRIKEHHCLAMADCATYEEGMICQQLGVDFIGSTLSGYVTKGTPDEPDLMLVQQLSRSGCKVIAEGRYNSPYLAAQAIESGAFAVTVGSAITRIEHICEWFELAIRQASNDKNGGG